MLRKRFAHWGNWSAKNLSFFDRRQQLVCGDVKTGTLIKVAPDDTVSQLLCLSVGSQGQRVVRSYNPLLNQTQPCINETWYLN